MRLLLPLLFGCASASGEARVDEGPLVIELFTSQGCSSCPPADQLLSKLAHAGELAGRKLAPLSFHVDYWDSLGWPDPYASATWTARQQAYAHVLDDRVYTPELVIAGAADVVGNQSTRVAQAIAAAPHQGVLAASATWRADKLSITATAPADADVYVAIWEDGTRTPVGRGENAGETLIGDRVVRRLERVAVAGKTATLELPAEKSWHGAVAFAQRADRAIVAARLLLR